MLHVSPFYFVRAVQCGGGCEHGGECVVDGVRASCKCPHGYQGDRCQYGKNINHRVIRISIDYVIQNETRAYIQYWYFLMF